MTPQNTIMPLEEVSASLKGLRLAIANQNGRLERSQREAADKAITDCLHRLEAGKRREEEYRDTINGVTLIEPSTESARNAIESCMSILSKYPTSTTKEGEQG